ncbi:MAG: response regulator [Polyangiaceae bacterium]|nr:response regulator [Polyangiaceae bacterium]
MFCRDPARFLTQAGHTVTAVETASSAFAELASHTFDLVITDVRLPDIDGFAVLDRVRETSPDTVTFAMIAYGWVGSAAEALRHGAHDYIVKPLSFDDLERKVERSAEYKRLGAKASRLRSLAVRNEKESADEAPESAKVLMNSEAEDEACNLERATLGFQRIHIARVLDRCHGRRDAAAKLLGLSPATFYRYIQKVGLKGYKVDEVRHA